MVKAIDKIRPLDIKLICPGHGPVHKELAGEIVRLTEKYSDEYIAVTGEKDIKRVLIAYVSAYGYTGEAADLIAEGLAESGRFDIDVADIETMPDGELDAKLTASDAVIAGSPTINQNTLLPLYRLFALINPLRDRGKAAGAFGSYGWSGEAPKIILDNFRNLKLNTFEEPVTFKFAPGGPKKEILVDYGRRFGEMLLEKKSETKNPGV